MPPPQETPATLEDWEHFPTVNNDTAQLRLARAMGYPPGWRVVRTLVKVPIPTSLAESMMAKGGPTVTRDDAGIDSVIAVQDRIYAGDPVTHPDGYYNHTAALEASAKYPWRPQYDDVFYFNSDDDYDAKEYCSTSHKNKGGHLKKREPKFQEGDLVQVLYMEGDQDDGEQSEWYEATIVKRVEYEDDIRYSVHYHADDAIQKNVRETCIRATKNIKKKKLSKVPTNKKKSKNVLPKTQKKRGRPKGSKTISPVRDEESSFDDMSVDIVEGTVSKNLGMHKLERKRTTAPNVDSMKRSVDVGLDNSISAKKTKGKRGRPKKIKNDHLKSQDMLDDSQGETFDAHIQNSSLDEGDPPWRMTGHSYISRHIQWAPAEASTKPSIGKVVGWISENDVDTEGNPGFVSARTGKPARLFHALFDEFEQDFEEWELKECLVEKDEA